METLTNNIKSASVFLKNKRVQVSYYTLDGVRHRFSTGKPDTKHNFTVAKRQKYILAKEHYERNRPSDSKTLFKEIALEALRSNASNRNKETQEYYESLLERSLIPVFQNLEIGNIKPMHVEQWKSGVIAKGVSKSNFSKHWTTLNMIMQFLTKNELIDKNPMLLVGKTSKGFKESSNRSEKYYSASEVNTMLKGSTGWFRAYLHTMFMTGMRTSEGLALEWKNVDFEKQVITIEHSVRKGKIKDTKTGQIRTVSMSKILKEVLQEHYPNRISDIYVFPSYKTLKPYHGTNAIVRNHLKPLLKRLGIEYKTIYATRHSFASNLVQNNVPITHVQKMLGHSKLETTMAFYVKNGLLDNTDMAPVLDGLYGT